MFTQYKELPLKEFEQINPRARFKTYIWQYEHNGHFTAVYDKNVQEYLQYKIEDLIYINLLPSPSKPPYDEYISKINMYDNALNYFFKEVLTSGRDEEINSLATDTFNHAILPKSKLQDIESVIKSYGFEKHLGFFIHLVCRIQNVYQREIAFNTKREQIQRRKKLPEQVNTLIEIIKNHKKFSKSAFNKHITQIKFVDSYGPKVIDDYGLILGILDAAQEYWSSGNQKNWEKNLRQVAFDEEEMTKIDYFTERLSVVLYQFITQSELIPLGANKLSNSAVLFVWKILNLADINTYDRDSRPHELDINKKDIVSLIKGYVRRHKVVKKPLYYDLNIDLNDLKKYFNHDFIDSVDLRVQPNEYELGLSICNKYEINEIRDEITLILKCLRHYKIHLDFQNNNFLKNKGHAELNALLKLIEVSETDYNSLESISLKFKDDNEHQNISTDALKILLLDAIRVHKSLNPEEFTSDIWKTDFKKDKHEGLTQFIDGKRLNHPGERFLVQFTSSFANFLESKGITSNNQLEEEKNLYYIINACLVSAQLILSSPSAVFFQKIKRWLSLNKDLKS